MAKQGCFYNILSVLGRFLSSLALALVLILMMTPDHISRADNFDLRLSMVADGERFDLMGWLVGAFARKIEYRLSNDLAQLSESQRQSLVDEYFKLARDEEDLHNKLFQQRAASAPVAQLQALSDQVDRKRADKLLLEQRVEAIIAERVERAAQSEGLAQNLPLNPQIILPPVAFKYVALPLLLVMSPHEKIENRKALHLLPGLTLSQIEQAEAEADSLGMVSLVVPIGGIGTYPTMVLETSSYDVTLDIVSHEWTHNYLDVRPLGWHYSDNGEMTSINETTANIVGHELSNQVRGLPPPTYDDEPLPAPPKTDPSKPAEFDFNHEMRLTRLAVDDMLKDGKVKEAEAYMEEKRKVFVSHGYALRKLNQAYFAFYGSYADGGVGTVNPIGGELKRLRVASGSLKEFLDNIASVSNFDEYRALLKAKGVPEGKR
jgi:hypothetical protein